MNETNPHLPHNAREAFHVTDATNANWVVRRVVEARAYCKRVQQWAEAEIRRARRREQWLLLRFGVELEAWARQELAKVYPKRRSINLPGGKIGFRTAPVRLAITDESKALAWCREHLPGAVRTVEMLVKSEVRQYFKSTGEIIDGTELAGGEPKFFIG